MTATLSSRFVLRTLGRRVGGTRKTAPFVMGTMAAAGPATAGVTAFTPQTANGSSHHNHMYVALPKAGSDPESTKTSTDGQSPLSACPTSGGTMLPPGPAAAGAVAVLLVGFTLLWGRRDTASATPAAPPTDRPGRQGSRRPGP